jgi:hypothetical protein
VTRHSRAPLRIWPLVFTKPRHGPTTSSGTFNKAADDLTEAADELGAAGGAADETAWLRARALEARFRASEEAPAAGIGASD